MEGGERGDRCGVVSDDALPLPIAATTRSGENDLVVHLANTAQNFVSDKPPVPFGLSSASVDR